MSLTMPPEFQQSQTSSQELRQEQQVGPKLYQMMELVSLPLLELQQRLRQEMQTNPFLELTDLDDGWEESLEGIENGSGDEMDWEEILIGSFDAGGRLAEHEEREQWRPTPRASQDVPARLTEQFRLRRTDPVIRALGEEIIGNLDDRGYLTTPLSLIVRSVRHRGAATRAGGEEGVDRRPTIHDAFRALREVQSMDPAGIGARNLRECLLIQLRAAGEEGSLAWRLLVEHFEDFVQHRWGPLARTSGFDADEIEAAASRLARCTPHPAGPLETSRDEYVIPDVIVREIDGRLHVLHNDGSVPRLRISSAYREVARNRDRFEGENRAFITKKLNSARWVVRAIEQRNQTVRKVVETLVDTQDAFFRKGIEHLKPLTLADVAERIGMHESTVSRVANGKYVQTPRGTYPISFFFSPGLTTDYGDEISARAVRAKMAEMIEGEDPADPLTDRDIADRLRHGAGVQMSRRTVAKYRKQMGILGSRQRKRSA